MKEQWKDRAGVERVRVFLQMIFIPLPDSFASLPSKLFDASAVAVSGSFGKMMQVSIPCPLDTDWRQANDTMSSYIAAWLPTSPSPGHQSLCFPLHLHWDLPTAVRLWTTTTLSVKSKTGKAALSVGLGRQKTSFGEPASKIDKFCRKWLYLALPFHLSSSTHSHSPAEESS